MFVRYLGDQLKLEAQSEVIGLLLKDFQQRARDWLRETDANGSLVRLSDRFTEAASKTVAELQGALFSDVIVARRNTGRSMRNFSNALASESRFAITFCRCPSAAICVTGDRPANLCSTPPAPSAAIAASAPT